MFIETEKLPGFEAFKANDDDVDTRWLSAETNNQYVEVAWIHPQTFNTVVIDEVGNAIKNHKIQVWQDGAWNDVAVGTVCGKNKTYEFDSVTATKCRVFIENATTPPSISEWKIKNKKND